MKRFIAFVLGACVVAALATPALAQGKTRESVDLGMFGWFPSNRADLKVMVDKFLSDAGEIKLEGKPIAIVAPHAGLRYSGSVAGTVFKAIAGRHYDRVIVLAPSHHAGTVGGHIGDWDYYATPLGLTEIDKQGTRKMLASGTCRDYPGVDDKEHSVQNELPFLETVQPDLKMVPIVIGSTQTDETIRKLGDAVRSLLTPDTLIVVSSDFTHYGRAFAYTPYTDNIKENIRKGDQGAVDLICSLDFAGYRKYMSRANAPTICGTEAISVMLRALEGRKDVHGKLLRYANSADMEGGTDHCVSYASVVMVRVEGAAQEAPLKDAETVIEVGPGGAKPAPVPDKVSEADQRTLLAMAREQLVKVVKEKKMIDAKDYGWDLTRKLQSQGATFVTLQNGDRLRGCIGDIQPVSPIYASVIRNTVNAAIRDPRFVNDRITVDELPKINIEITVLTPFVEVGSYTEIVIGKHGCYLQKNGRSAVFLPQVAPEQHWDRDTMLKELCLKAGLPADSYKEKGCRFWVFEGQIFNEQDMRIKHAGE